MFWHVTKVIETMVELMADFIEIGMMRVVRMLFIVSLEMLAVEYRSDFSSIDDETAFCVETLRERKKLSQKAPCATHHVPHPSTAHENIDR